MSGDKRRINALLVGAGIFLSRIFGLIRQRVFAHFLGLSDAADIFSAALRIPNLLQNLFGEGALSGSFIPIYARLLAEGRREEAGQLAGSVAAILALGISALVALGVLTTPYLLWAIAPGYVGEKRELTILIVRILFPGTGILVWSAWCLGILNSHGRFFLSYAAPVVWNVSMIATLLIYREADHQQLIVYLAWGTVLGSLLQFLVQLVPVLKLASPLRLAFRAQASNVRHVVANFGTVAVGRGVVQISAFVDQAIATLLGTGAVAAITTASLIYMLPISLFGMAVSAAELPAMSGMTDPKLDPKSAASLANRVNGSLEHIAFFVVPSAVAFIALGNVIVAAIFQTGAFTSADTRYVWAILAGAGMGLLASTFGRLYTSTHYALRDTRTPLHYALVRLATTSGLGLATALLGPRLLGIPAQWGAVGLAVSGAIAGWIEFYLLRRALNRRIGPTGIAFGTMLKLWAAAAAAALAACALEYFARALAPLPMAIAVLGTYSAVYGSVTLALRNRVSLAIVRKVLPSLSSSGR